MPATFKTHTIQLALFAFLMSFGHRAFAERLAFELPGLDGQRIQLRASEGPAVICFLGTECPMAKAYVGSLNRILGDHRERGLRVIGVMSNRQDTPSEIVRYAEETGVKFEVCIDEFNRVADLFGAKRTPEVYLLDAELKLRYHGRIDDQYAPGVARKKPRRQDLNIAVKELLDGRPISVIETEATGCIIGRWKNRNTTESGGELHSIEAPGTLTFYKDVFPMLQQYCIECHREGEIGPFAMQDYEEVAGWADTMLETMQQGRMPPWHADPKVGQFANARHLPKEATQLLSDWIDTGARQGDPKDRPAPLVYVDGWELSREPDMVLPMRERPFQVPADGVVEYQYFVVDPGFKEDKWISAAQVIPGSRDVVHHAILFVRPPDGGEFQGVGWLTGYVPGQRLNPLPPGFARKVPAGSKFVFQMHYTPVGIERNDVSKLGILFADPDEVTHSVYTMMAINQEFEIPPGEPSFEVEAKLRTLPNNSQLLAVTPHMHYRGKSFGLFSGTDESPDASALLSVPAYDFNWQHTYAFSKPLAAKDLADLSFVATFDNSEENPFNPDPDQWVAWGDQTWEEMAVAFFEVAIPTDEGARYDKRPPTDPEHLEQLRRDYVEEVFEELDTNSDGLIRKGETSIIVRRWNFWRWDKNRDGIATREEVERVAQEVIR